MITKVSREGVQIMYDGNIKKSLKGNGDVRRDSAAKTPTHPHASLS